MANEELVQAVKQIVAHLRAGRLDEGYEGYKNIFTSPNFVTYRPEDQRQALKLMILAKGVPSRPTPPMIDAHQAAIPALTKLVSEHGEPADYELLGVCYVTTGDEQSADATFRTGLNLERERHPGSDLCGALMKRISML